MRMPHQPTATLSPSLVHPHRRRSIPFCNLLTLSSFYRFTFLVCPPLTCPPFFSHRNPSLRSLFYLLSLSLSRAFFSVFVIPSFFPFFFKTLFIVFLSSHFHSHFSRFQFFHFLLSKIYLFLISYRRFSLHFHYFYRYIRYDSNYITAAVAHLFQIKKSFNLYRSLIFCSLLAAHVLSSPPFLDHCSLFLQSRIIIIYFLVSHMRCCIVPFHILLFYETLIISCFIECE